MPERTSPNAHNFTILYPGLVKVISSSCGLAMPITNGKFPENFKPLQFEAIWDTGATNSVITVKAAQMLGLVPIGRSVVQGVHTRSEKNVYAVSLALPNKVVLEFVPVTECDDLSDGFDVLIGMDIIGIGDFAITNSGGQTMFSYRFPSVTRIDFKNSENNVNIDTPPKQSFTQKFKNQTRTQNKKKGR